MRDAYCGARRRLTELEPAVSSLLANDMFIRTLFNASGTRALKQAVIGLYPAAPYRAEDTLPPHLPLTLANIVAIAKLN